jgi:hypothetical protein
VRRGNLEATRRAKACLRHLEESKSLNRHRQRPDIFWTSHTVRGVFDLTQQPPAMTPCRCYRQIDGASPQRWVADHLAANPRARWGKTGTGSLMVAEPSSKVRMIGRRAYRPAVLLFSGSSTVSCPNRWLFLA